MKKIGKYFFWACVVFGLIIRLFSLSYNGIFDLATYNEWGLATLKNGLDHSFMGTYFPFQYQIFEFNSWLSGILNLDYFIVYKSVNLVFDCGNLIILTLILRRLGVSEFYSLLYWLHPWFLNMFSLGYVDFQFTFFILCSLYFIFRDTSRDYLKASIFLGFAFMMKPQVLIIFISFFIYAIVRYFRNKNINMIHLFIFPAVLFIDYYIFFLIQTGSASVLSDAYLHTADSSPILNGHFLNGWFPVAYYLKGANDPIHSVTDDLNGSGFPARSIAIITVLSLLLYFIIKTQRDNSVVKLNIGPYLTACFASFAVPFLMTAAHENHLFLGTVLIIPVLAKSRNLLFKIVVHILLLLQFINLYGYYGIGENPFFQLPVYQYTYKVALIMSFIATFLFLAMLYYFFSTKSKLFSSSE